MLASVAVLSLPTLPTLAADAGVAEAVNAAFGTKKALPGRITITAPPLAESGNTVPLTVTVDSPMTETDRVRRVVLFANRNPRPLVASMLFGPAAPRAEFSTNIRLNGTQDVIAFAEMNDGAVYSTQVRVEVTVGACDTLQIRF
jgi:sulfur-oxidizing protein SoxY